MPTVRLQPSGREVVCTEGETVLTALERAGYALRNNCRAGACGECKTRVLSGQLDQGMVLDMALSAADRAEGYGLMCMATPLSDTIEIEFGTADARPKLFPPREHLPFVVTDRIERTARIVELRLRPLGKPLRYWPGQYIILGDEAEGAPPRSYSIANAPRPDGELTLLVSLIPEGVTSGWVHYTLVAGSPVSISGPYGTFIGDPSVETPVLCIAAGSGLAPILALADAALRRGFSYPVTVVFSARTEADVFDEGLMAYWTAKHRRFQFVRTLTREDGAAPTGRIQEILPDLFPDLSDHSIFIAGSPEFVEDARRVVEELGALAALIHTEGYHRRQDPEPPPRDQLVD